jgi:hypothetical protein
LRTKVLNASRNFSQPLHPNNAFSLWDQSRSKLLTRENLTALRFFSQTARRYRTLRVIPPNSRDDALKEIAEVIEAVRCDNDLDQWMRALLLVGLQRVQLIIRHVFVFGHDAAITELFLLHQKLIVFAQTGKEKPSMASSFWKTLTVLSLVGNLFVLPDQGVAALDRYKMWTSVLANEVLAVITAPQAPPDQRLLPPPAALVPRGNADSDGPDKNRC